MDFELGGKVALVTGSSRGIGRAIAETLHSEGCKVCINSRNRDDLFKVAKTMPGSVITQGDVSCPQEAQNIVKKVLASFGRIDILVCNVGSGSSIKPGEEDHEEWKRVFAINLWSTTNIVEAAGVALEESKGSIVCISSICGLEVVAGAPVTYSVAKAALNAYVRGIARPLGRKGMRINAIALGNILFEGSVWSRKLANDTNTVKLMIERDVALNQFGTPQNAAELVAYLVSPRSSFATGGVWTLDGGQVHS
ncbi:SDR family oxidoreductase [Nitrospinae bacterium]|nr:SDR family oxidoreductase [Nitrospinota bacterium]